MEVMILTLFSKERENKPSMFLLIYCCY